MNIQIKNIVSKIIILFFILGISASLYLYFTSFDIKDYLYSLHLTLYHKVIIILFIYCVRNYLLIPSTIIILFTGYFLENLLLTVIISVLGVGIGILQTYFVGYIFGESLKNKKEFNLIKKYKEKIKKSGYKIIFMGAFIPIIPVDIIYYSAGISSYSVIKTLLAGLIGEFPLIILYAYLGEKAHTYEQYIIIITLIILLIYGGYVLRKKLGIIKK